MNDIPIQKKKWIPPTSIKAPSLLVQTPFFSNYDWKLVKLQDDEVTLQPDLKPNEFLHFNTLVFFVLWLMAIISIPIFIVILGVTDITNPVGFLAIGIYLVVISGFIRFLWSFWGYKLFSRRWCPQLVLSRKPNHLEIRLNWLRSGMIHSFHQLPAQLPELVELDGLLLDPSLPFTVQIQVTETESIIIARDDSLNDHLTTKCEILKTFLTTTTIKQHDWPPYMCLDSLVFVDSTHELTRELQKRHSWWNFITRACKGFLKWNKYHLVREQRNTFTMQASSFGDVVGTGGAFVGLFGILLIMVLMFFFFISSPETGDQSNLYIAGLAIGIALVACSLLYNIREIGACLYLKKSKKTIIFDQQAKTVTLELSPWFKKHLRVMEHLKKLFFQLNLSEMNSNWQLTLDTPLGLLVLGESRYKENMIVLQTAFTHYWKVGTVLDKRLFSSKLQVNNPTYKVTVKDRPADFIHWRWSSEAMGKKLELIGLLFVIFMMTASATMETPIVLIGLVLPAFLLLALGSGIYVIKLQGFRPAVCFDYEKRVVRIRNNGIWNEGLIHKYQFSEIEKILINDNYGEIIFLFVVKDDQQKENPYLSFFTLKGELQDNKLENIQVSLEETFKVVVI